MQAQPRKIGNRKPSPKSTDEKTNSRGIAGNENNLNASPNWLGPELPLMHIINSPKARIARNIIVKYLGYLKSCVMRLSPND